MSSPLLKALDKSKEQEGAQPQEGASAEGEGGFKLSGGSGPSKLGSALAAKTGETPKASSVVAAYQTDEAQRPEDVEGDTLARASRVAMFKNIAYLVVAVAVAGGGWYAYQRFAPMILPGQQAQQSQSAPSGGEEAPVAAPSDSVLLPLAEPIYDIQESILIASLGGSADSSSGSDAGTEEDIADKVRGVVASIIDEQLATRREQQRELEQRLNVVSEESIEEEVSKVIDEFDPAEARQISSTQSMLAQLEQLGSAPLVSADRRQYVKPVSYDLAALDEAEAEAAAAAAETPAPAPAPAEEPASVLIAKGGNDLGRVLDEGSASYIAGDLNNAETAFRTVVAAEPKNVSALVGLAKVHQSRGNVRLAVATLLKASEYAPNDPVVVSELIAIQSASSNPVLSAARLRELLGRTTHPEVQSRLLFILGTVFARQGLWIDAKTAFVDAHSINRGNPDISYNLAVVNDYLNDKDEAIRLYSEALSAAVSSPSSFDHAVARARLDQLSGN